MEARRPANAVVHGSCGSWWTGSQVAHCGACHETFSGLTSFDLHQRQVADGQRCRKPVDAGLIARAKPWGVLWCCPSNDSPWGLHGVEEPAGVTP